MQTKIFFICLIGFLSFSHFSFIVHSQPYINHSNEITNNLENTLEEINIFYLNDLHGWLEPHDGFGGVATLFSHMIDQGYTNSSTDNSLFLLGGDYNTGPGIATVSKGEAVVDALNAMNLDASAIGNHEFDFGIDILLKQKNNASFDLLSANIFNQGTLNHPAFAVPYVITNVSDIPIGIIGLTLTATANSVLPTIVGGYDFGEYEDSLRLYVPEMRSKGAKIIIVLAHVPGSDLITLNNAVSDLNIPLFLGGHSHAYFNQVSGSSLIFAVQAYNTQFGKVVISYNKTSSKTESVSIEVFDNTYGTVTPNPVLDGLVQSWKNKLNLDEVLTKSLNDIYDTDEVISIGGLISYSYLYYFNFSHNFAVCPRGGGIRDYFRKGNITVNDVISVMPFEDYLVEFLIKGEDLQTELKTSLSGPFISGIKFMDGTYKIFVDGEFRQLESNKLYSGIMLDYSYFLKGFEKYEFNETHIHYRDPVIKYFKTLDSLQDHKFNILNSISTGDSSNTSETVISSEKESSGTISTISSVNVLIIFSVLISAVFIRRKKSRR